jgi:hypothetical protein
MAVPGGMSAATSSAKRKQPQFQRNGGNSSGGKSVVRGNHRRPQQQRGVGGTSRASLSTLPKVPPTVTMTNATVGSRLTGVRNNSGNSKQGQRLERGNPKAGKSNHDRKENDSNIYNDKSGDYEMEDDYDDEREDVNDDEEESRNEEEQEEERQNQEEQEQGGGQQAHNDESQAKDDDDDDDNDDRQAVVEDAHQHENTGTVAKKSSTKSSTASSLTTATTGVSGGLWLENGTIGDSEMAKAVIRQRRNMIKGYVKDTLFKKVKFIVSDKQMEWDFKSFAVPILNFMGVSDEDDDVKKRLWNDFKLDAKKALQEKRASINGAVKSAIVCKLLATASFMACCHVSNSQHCLHHTFKKQLSRLMIRGSTLISDLSSSGWMKRPIRFSVTIYCHRSLEKLSGNL